MKEHIFTDENGKQLIIQHRKSAIFFLKKYKDEDLAEHRSDGIYIDGVGLYANYEFVNDAFSKLYEYLVKVGTESWKELNPRVADSMGTDYDDYYDRDFDNNGSLNIGMNRIIIEGPYAQPPNKDHLTRLIKFNKRKFESFIYDFRKALGGEQMNPTQQIKYIVDQIVIAYCNYKKFRDEKFGSDFESWTAQLMVATGLDRDGALKYACDVLANRNKCEGVA